MKPIESLKDAICPKCAVKIFGTYYEDNITAKYYCAIAKNGYFDDACTRFDDWQNCLLREDRDESF